MKKHSLLIFLYILLIIERFYGIWFLRWAFDEEQNFGGGTAMLKWGLNLFGAGIPNPEMEHLVSIYGIVGKYLAVVPVAMGFALEKILSIDLPIPLGLIFTRIVVSFLPNVLTIVLIHKMIRLVSDNKVFLFSTLTLFLFTFKHIETAHYGVSDGLSTFFVVWSVYCFLRFSLEGKQKYLIWTAVACVLAISTKVNVGVVISGVIGGLLLFEHRGTETQRSFERRDQKVESLLKNEGNGSENLGNHFQFWQWLNKTCWKNIAVFGFTSIIAFALINLPYLVNFGEWYGELERHIHEYPYTIKGSFLTPFYFRPAFGVGFPILLMALGGVVLQWTMVLRRTVDDGRQTMVGNKCSKNLDNSCKLCQRLKQMTIDRILFFPALLFLVFFYIYLAFSRGVIHRWAIPMTPFLVLFAAYFVEIVYRWSVELIRGKHKALPLRGGMVWGKHKALPLRGGMVRGKHKALLLRIEAAIRFVGFGAFFLLGIQPLYHVLQFDLGLTASSNTYQGLQNFAEKNIKSNTCIYNVEGIKLKNYCSEKAPLDIPTLQNSSIEYIVFSDFWFSERRYPSSILYLEVIDQRTHGNWRLIRDFIEGENSGWKLEHTIQPEYFSYWSTNIAQPPVFYVYKRI